MAGDDSRIELAEFVRLHHIRAPQIMWFFGAGASASAGVATAGQMVTEFKRRLFCTDNKIPITQLDVRDPGAQRRIERHFVDHPRYPRPGAPDEYAALFEALYPDASDRRRFIEDAIQKGKPSYGHLVLGALATIKKVSAIWTTNFDHLVESACAQSFGTTARLKVADLQRPEIAERSLNESDWPVLVKLHGDFQSERLKNTSDELRNQDRQFQLTLVRACARAGLAVVGYSGRDDSVMDALLSVLDEPTPFPYGLYWFNRHGTAPFHRVSELLDKARGKGVSAALVDIGAFDELFGEVAGLFELPKELQSQLDANRPRERRIAFSLPSPGKKSFPVLRLNAIPILAVPQTARLIDCKIAGARAVRDALAGAGTASVVAARRRDGVIAFGSDEDARRIFEPFGITTMGVATVDVANTAHRDTADLSLLYDAFTRALVRQRGLVEISRRRRLVAIDSTNAGAQRFAPLADVVGRLRGPIPGSHSSWVEGISFRFEFRHDRLWLVFVPTICTPDRMSDDDDAPREFIRDRKAGRFNSKWNELLEAWATVITEGNPESELRAFGDVVGVDAIFRVGKRTAYAASEGAGNA